MQTVVTGIVLALGIGAASPAYAQHAWTLAAQTGTSSFLVSVDPERVQGPAELRAFTVLMVKQSSAAGIPQIASENDWEFNCVDRTWRWVASRAIASNGNIFSNEWEPTDWAPLRQDAIGYMSGFACGDTKPIGPEFADTKAAIDALWKVAAPAN